MKAWYRKSHFKRLIQLVELYKKPDVSLRKAPVLLLHCMWPFIIDHEYVYCQVTSKNGRCQIFRLPLSKFLLPHLLAIAWLKLYTQSQLSAHSKANIHIVICASTDRVQWVSVEVGPCSTVISREYYTAVNFQSFTLEYLTEMYIYQQYTSCPVHISRKFTTKIFEQ